MQSALRSTQSARSVTSAALPIGVATTYNARGNCCWSSPEAVHNGWRAHGSGASGSSMSHRSAGRAPNRIPPPVALFTIPEPTAGLRVLGAAALVRSTLVPDSRGAGRVAAGRLWRRGGSSMQRAIGWVVVAAGLGVAMLDGCVVPLVGAAAVGGTGVATDRRAVGIQVEDKAIESRVNAALIDKIPKTAVNINVTSYNRKVLLAGQGRTAEMRALAEQAAAKSENVREVVNELTVGAPASPGDRTDDTLLAGKDKTALLGAEG